MKRAATYADELTLEQARARYFEANGFGPEGGYDAAWVDFKLGPVPFPFPNTPPRRRAVRYHDLHHIVTGYQTDFIGELEISAWEIGSGCRDMLAAWQLNLGGLAAGLFLAPRRVLGAFVRGRRSDNFYGRPAVQPLLAMQVGAARRLLNLDGAAGPAKGADLLLFGVAAATGLAVAVASFALFAPLALVAWPWLTLARRSSRNPR